MLPAPILKNKCEQDLLRTGPLLNRRLSSQIYK